MCRDRGNKGRKDGKRWHSLLLAGDGLKGWLPVAGVSGGGEGLVGSGNWASPPSASQPSAMLSTLWMEPPPVEISWRCWTSLATTTSRRQCMASRSPAPSGIPTGRSSGSSGWSMRTSAKVGALLTLGKGTDSHPTGGEAGFAFGTARKVPSLCQDCVSHVIVSLTPCSRTLWSQTKDSHGSQQALVQAKKKEQYPQPQGDEKQVHQPCQAALPHSGLNCCL